MVVFYYKRVIQGKKLWTEIPELWKDDVCQMLVDNGYTLNVDGSGTINGSISGFTTAFTTNAETSSGADDDGVLNLKDVTLTGNGTDVLNNGKVNLTGTTSLDTISGDGTANIGDGVTSTSVTLGQSLVQKALNILTGGKLTATAGSVTTYDKSITNNGTVELNGGTSSEIGRAHV